MNRTLLAICLAAAPLSSCATVLSPERCEQALAAAQTAEQIIAVLVNRGMLAEKARRIAEAVLVGQVALEAACAVAERR